MVSVDTVYQRVLALANKEQRGYITPQEFNLYANQAQMDIFRQYFYDINQFKRIPSNNSNYSNTVDLIEEKIAMFKMGPVPMGDTEDISGIYKLIQVTKQDSSNIGGVAQKINYEDYHASQNSPLTKATKSRPIYYIKDNTLYVHPTLPGTNNHFRFIRKPDKVSWTYVIVDEKALYNPSNGDHADFDLHVSEENNLVIKILQLSGIAIKDYNVVQAAAQKEIGTIQQEKQ